MDDSNSLHDLRDDFRRGSTTAMPIAGMIVWAALGIAALFLTPTLTGWASLYIMPVIMPLAWAIDRLRGRNLFASTGNPLEKLFLISIIGIGLTVPAIVTGAEGGQPTLMVLGMAILAGVIWIPWGWAADDPSGLRHAIARALGAYAAYALVPQPYTASAICAVVVVAYLYSLIAMPSDVGRAAPA